MPKNFLALSSLAVLANGPKNMAVYDPSAELIFGSGDAEE